jgi:hypothetical protein
MWTDKYLGIPFREHGRDFKGCDCGGLVLLILREERGVIARDINTILARSDYQTRAGHAKVQAAVAECLQEWVPVSKEHDPRPYDLALYRLSDGTECHCGCLVDQRYMIHVESSHTAHLDLYARPQGGYILSGVFRHARLL